MVALSRDYREADLSDQDRAMLDFSVKLTLEPWAMKKGDIEKLREVGFDDRAILDINQIIAYYAYANRIADGLGIELEGFWQ